MAVKQKARHRALSILDVKILNFLWKWKLANLMAMKYGLARERSFWRFYQILRRLHNEGYIKIVSIAENSIPLFTITKKGFQYLNDGSMELVQKRYQPQALLHDYWTTVFHLGEFILRASPHVELVSEQEFTAKELADLPEWLPRTKDHIPDGFTRIVTSNGPQVVAFEVELSTKSDSRYQEMIRYLDINESINWVFWLCANRKIIQKITQQIVEVKRRRPMIHNFVLLDDVRNKGWAAPFLWGYLEKTTPGDFFAQQPGQQALNIPLTTYQPAAMAIFLAKDKSPRKFKGLGSSVDPLEVLTPKGPGI